MRSVRWKDTKAVGLEELKGLILSKVERFDDEQIEFETVDGRVFIMYHDQDCCESVEIEDVVGDLQDLVGEPILLAEEVSGETAAPSGWAAGKYDDSYTWTFYKFATRKGYVDIRWFGSSNGYYSEEVSFVELKEQ